MLLLSAKVSRDPDFTKDFSRVLLEMFVGNFSCLPLVLWLLSSRADFFDDFSDLGLNTSAELEESCVNLLRPSALFVPDAEC